MLSSVNAVKMILSGAENFFENESNLQSFKGSHSLLSIFCCNFSWKKLSKCPGISWNFDFEFVWQPWKMHSQNCSHKKIDFSKLLFQNNTFFKTAFSKNVNLVAFFYVSSDSPEEEKSQKLSLICLINFFSMHLHSFKNTWK